MGISLAAASAWGDEVVDSAADLEAEAEGCREVQQLCDRSEALDEALEAARSAVEADATVENVGRYRDAFSEAEGAFLELNEVARMLWGKDPQRADCIRECRQLGP